MFLSAGEGEGDRSFVGCVIGEGGEFVGGWRFCRYPWVACPSVYLYNYASDSHPYGDVFP